MLATTAGNENATVLGVRLDGMNDNVLLQYAVSAECYGSGIKNMHSPNGHGIEKKLWKGRK